MADPALGVGGQMLAVAGDRGELGRIQGGPADERAVDILLRHDGSDIAGLDRTAIQDPIPSAVSPEYISASSVRMAEHTSWASSGVATSPVPMAQIGS